LLHVLAELLAGAVEVVLVTDGEEALAGLLGRQDLLLQGLDLFFGIGELSLQTADLCITLVECSANFFAKRTLHASCHLLVLRAQCFQLFLRCLPLLVYQLALRLKMRIALIGIIRQVTISFRQVIVEVCQPRNLFLQPLQRIPKLRNVDVPLVNLAITCFDRFLDKLFIDLALMLLRMQSLFSPQSCIFQCFIVVCKLIKLCLQVHDLDALSLTQTGRPCRRHRRPRSLTHGLESFGHAGSTSFAFTSQL